MNTSTFTLRHAAHLDRLDRQHGYYTDKDEEGYIPPVVETDFGLRDGATGRYINTKQADKLRGME